MKLAVISHRGALSAPKWQYLSRSFFTSDISEQDFCQPYLFSFSFQPKFKTKRKLGILGFLFCCKGDISDAWCTTEWETKTVYDGGESDSRPKIVNQKRENLQFCPFLLCLSLIEITNHKTSKESLYITILRSLIGVGHGHLGVSQNTMYLSLLYSVAKKNCPQKKYYFDRFKRE